MCSSWATFMHVYTLAAGNDWMKVNDEVWLEEERCTSYSKHRFTAILILLKMISMPISRLLL